MDLEVGGVGNALHVGSVAPRGEEVNLAGVLAEEREDEAPPVWRPVRCEGGVVGIHELEGDLPQPPTVRGDEVELAVLAGEDDPPAVRRPARDALVVRIGEPYDVICRRPVPSTPTTNNAPLCDPAQPLAAPA